MHRYTLYSPLEFYLHDKPAEEATGEYWGDDFFGDAYRLDPQDALEYKDAIELHVRRDVDYLDRTRGLAEFLDGSLEEKVQSIFPIIVEHDGQLWCAAKITTGEELTPDEFAELISWYNGQLSDGWGEGIEQREVPLGNGLELYIVPWTPDDDFFVDNEAGFRHRLGYSEASDMEAVKAVRWIDPAEKRSVLEQIRQAKSEQADQPAQPDNTRNPKKKAPEL